MSFGTAEFENWTDENFVALESTWRWLHVIDKKRSYLILWFIYYNFNMYINLNKITF